MLNVVFKLFGYIDGRFLWEVFIVHKIERFIYNVDNSV